MMLIRIPRAGKVALLTLIVLAAAGCDGGSSKTSDAPKPRPKPVSLSANVVGSSDYYGNDIEVIQVPVVIPAHGHTAAIRENIACIATLSNYDYHASPSCDWAHPLPYNPYVKHE